MNCHDGGESAGRGSLIHKSGALVRVVRCGYPPPVSTTAGLGTCGGDLSGADIHAHYDQLLAAEGWQFEEDIAYSALGRIACYGKSDDRARVTSPGPGAGYTYAFSVAWELGRRPRCF